MVFAILSSYKRRHLLFHLWLWLNSLSIVFAQFHFDNPITTEKTNIPTSCKGPNGQPSLCVPPGRCNQLSALLKNLQKPISGDVAKYIKDSFDILDTVFHILMALLNYEQKKRNIFCRFYVSFAVSMLSSFWLDKEKNRFNCNFS